MAKFQQSKAIIDQLILTNLSVLGVKAANHARRSRGYKDRTGNLVNSTGFIILKDGANVFQDFKKTVTGGEPTAIDGMKVGQDLAMEIAADFANFRGWVLIVVAGMHYAANVEYFRGKNVLAATELYIRVEMPKTIAKIEKAFKKI